MIYDPPKFLIGGDSFITIELGDEGSLRMNLYVLSMERMIWDSKIEGLIDTTSLRTTIMIHYDPFIVQADQIIEQIRSISSEGITISPKIPSRIIYLPVYYDDPWTRECAMQHGVKPNVEIIDK
jgi:allophanate hydrolase subunit 1